MAEGPLGAVVELSHVDLPGAAPAVEDLSRILGRGGLALPPEIDVFASTVDLFELPAGRAVTMEADIEGRDGRVVIVPGSGEIWVASYRSDGNERSALDFDKMLLSLTIPPGR